MVRLKAMQLTGDELAIMRFQFHYGSVKRKAGKIANEEKSLFQFHYGSVKRLKVLRRALLQLHFNSTMVRLKASR